MGEDSAPASFAGQFETVWDVCPDEEIREAIHVVRRSRHNARVQAYSQAQGLEGTEQEVAVLQRLIRADFPGVLFTADPVMDNLTLASALRSGASAGVRMTGNIEQQAVRPLTSMMVLTCGQSMALRPCTRRTPFGTS